MVELVPVETDIDRSYRDGRISLAVYERLKKEEIREKLERRLRAGRAVPRVAADSHSNNRRPATGGRNARR